MSSPVSYPRRGLFSRLVFWLPLVLMALVVLMVAASWVWTIAVDEEWAIPRFFTFAGLVLIWILAALWLLVAHLPLQTKRSTLAIAWGVPLLVVILFRVEDIRVSGGMWPNIPWRFGAKPEDILDQHLVGAVNRPVPDSVDLGGRQPTDWPQFMGRNRDGIVVGTNFARDWSANPPKLLWRFPIGGGHSSFAVVDKALFTIEQRRNEEAITCYDADSGKQYWAFSYPDLFDERLGDKGPRATPTVIDGEVFALGANGKLTCLDARTGKVKWGPVNVLEGNDNVTWAMAGSPLVVDNEVIVSPGVQKNDAPYGTAVAYDRNTGKPLWSTSSRAYGGYSSPIIAKLAGKRQLLLLDGDGIAGYEMDDPKSKGHELWRHPWETQQHINVAQPLVLDDNRVLVSSGYRVGSAMLQIGEEGGKWNVKVLWKKPAPQCKFSSPAYHAGRIYALDNERLASFDAKTGKRISTGENYSFGQVLLCNDLLLVTGEFGELVLVDPADGELRELGRVQALTGRSWNPPAVANSQVYWRNNREMVCYLVDGGK